MKASQMTRTKKKKRESLVYTNADVANVSRWQPMEAKEFDVSRLGHVKSSIAKPQKVDHRHY